MDPVATSTKRDFQRNSSVRLYNLTEVQILLILAIVPPDAIALEFKTFSGNPFFLPNGSEVLAFDPTQPMYVGQPSKEMDHAWSQMLFARYFNLTAHEAQQVWGDQYLEYRNPNDGSFSGGCAVHAEASLDWPS